MRRRGADRIAPKAIVDRAAEDWPGRPIVSAPAIVPPRQPKLQAVSVSSCDSGGRARGLAGAPRLMGAASLAAALLSARILLAVCLAAHCWSFRDGRLERSRCFCPSGKAGGRFLLTSTTVL